MALRIISRRAAVKNADLLLAFKAYLKSLSSEINNNTMDFLSIIYELKYFSFEFFS